MVDLSKASKARKRAAVKASEDAPASKVKLTLYVSGETARRLAIHATMTGQDRSGLVESLIDANCRRFVVSDRARSDAPAMLEGSAS